MNIKFRHQLGLIFAGIVIIGYFGGWEIALTSVVAYLIGLMCPLADKHE